MSYQPPHKRGTHRFDRPRCVACNGSGYAEFPRAVERVEVMLGDSGLSVTRTVYEGVRQIGTGAYIKFSGKHVAVKKVDGKWVTENPEEAVVR
jgi:hypothetical protein